MLLCLRLCVAVIAAPLLLADGAADKPSPAFLPSIRPLGFPQSGIAVCRLGQLRGVRVATPLSRVRDVRVGLSAKKKEQEKKPGGGGFGKLGKIGPLKQEGGGFSNDGADLEEPSTSALKDSLLDLVSADIGGLG